MYLKLQGLTRPNDSSVACHRRSRVHGPPRGACLVCAHPAESNAREPRAGFSPELPRGGRLFAGCPRFPETRGVQMLRSAACTEGGAMRGGVSRGAFPRRRRGSVSVPPLASRQGARLKVQGAPGRVSWEGGRRARAQGACMCAYRVAPSGPGAEGGRRGRGRDHLCVAVTRSARGGVQLRNQTLGPVWELTAGNSSRVPS